jgi:hypothetical protein
MTQKEHPSTSAVRRVWLKASTLAAGRMPDDALTGQASIAVLLPWIDRGMAERASALMAHRAGHPCTIYCLHDDLGMGPLPLMNAALPIIDGDWVVYAAQDAFAGRYWLRFAVEALKVHPAGRLLAFNDGKWFGRLAAFGMVQRAWLSALYGGNLFHPGYRRHFADVELSLIARQQKALAYHPHALLVEADFEKDARPVEEADRAHFLLRKESGFDGRVNNSALIREFG